MRRQTEAPILRRVQMLFETAGGRCYKTGRSGEPDLICCLRGQTIVIETKRPGDVPRVLQFYRLEQWETAGAVARWTDSGVLFFDRHKEKADYDGESCTAELLVADFCRAPLAPPARSVPEAE